MNEHDDITAQIERLMAEVRDEGTPGARRLDAWAEAEELIRQLPGGREAVQQMKRRLRMQHGVEAIEVLHKMGIDWRDLDSLRD